MMNQQYTLRDLMWYNDMSHHLGYIDVIEKAGMNIVQYSIYSGYMSEIYNIYEECCFSVYGMLNEHKQMVWRNT